MLRAVIFDMDGTLLDSVVIHYIVINDILKRELGWEQTPEEYLKYCGIPDQKMWPMMMDEMDSGNVMSLARKWGMASDEVLPSVEDSGAKPQGNIGEESRRHGLSGQDSSGEGCSEQDGSGQGCFEQGSSEQDRSGQSSSRSEQGRSGREVPEQVKSALSAELERLHWAEYDLYIEKNGVKAFPGVRELMGALRTENIRIAVATGSLVRIVRENLKLLGIEEFVEGFLIFEEEVARNAESFRIKFLKEQEIYNKILKQCEIYKRENLNAENLNAEGFCKNAKISGEITDINIKKKLEGLKEIIIIVIFNKEKEELRFKIGGEANYKKSFEFRPTSRKDHFEFVMKGLNEKNVEFDIGSKIFPLGDIQSQEEYFVQIVVPEIDNPDQVAAFINASIILLLT